MSVLFPLANRRDAKIAINPLTWLAVGPTLADDVCGIVISREVVIEVVGTVAEVVAALEAAGAPAVAPVVEVAPTDLKLAAWVLDVVSAAIIDCDENDAVDDLSSTLFDSVNAGGHTHIALTALAARLRGAR